MLAASLVYSICTADWDKAIAEAAQRTESASTDKGTFTECDDATSEEGSRIVDSKGAHVALKVLDEDEEDA